MRGDSAAVITNNVAINEVFRGNFHVMCYTYTNLNIYAGTGSAVVSSISFLARWAQGCWSFLSRHAFCRWCRRLSLLSGRRQPGRTRRSRWSGRLATERTRGRVVLCVRAGVCHGLRGASGASASLIGKAITALFRDAGHHRRSADRHSRTSLSRRLPDRAAVSRSALSGGAQDRRVFLAPIWSASPSLSAGRHASGRCWPLF